MGISTRLMLVQSLSMCDVVSRRVNAIWFELEECGRTCRTVWLESWLSCADREISRAMSDRNRTSQLHGSLRVCSACTLDPQSSHFDAFENSRAETIV